jgi:hypothetical protein
MQAALRLYDKGVRPTLPALPIGVLMLSAIIQEWAKLQTGRRMP